jgi:hypothetical protein
MKGIGNMQPHLTRVCPSNGSFNGLMCRALDFNTTPAMKKHKNNLNRVYKNGAFENIKSTKEDAMQHHIFRTTFLKEAGTYIGIVKD